MADLHPDVIDAALDAIVADATHLYVCSQEPTTYLEASSTYAQAVKVGPTFAGPEDRPEDDGGRQIRLEAFSNGTISGNGAGAFWALVDANTTRLLLVQDCDPIVQLVSGEPLEIEEDLVIGMPGFRA